MSVPSSPPSESLEITYLERLREQYGSPTAEPAKLDFNPTLNDAENEEEYEFRLFSAPHAANVDHSSNVQRIAIRSPSPVNKEPGFVVPQRPQRHYFTSQLDVSRNEEFSAAAVSGEDVLKGLDTKWPGCYLPWRVSVIKSGLPKKNSNAQTDHDGLSSTSKSNVKKRSGKKRRIAIRMKLQNGERSRKEREIAEREKKTRVNRGKKVRRKMKEKAAKLEKEGDPQDVT